MSATIIQKGDLSAASFSNNNTNNGQGIAVRVDAGSTVGSAISAAIASGAAPTGTAGGALQGTYPNPSLSNDAVVNAVEAGISADAGAQSAIATAIIDNLVALPAFENAVKGKETTTTLSVSGVNYVFANENASQTVIQPSQFVSSDAGNAIGIGSDGRLKTTIPAQLPDDQVLSGDNSGTVAVSLTPTTIGDQTNYTIKADLKVAATTPENEDNLLNTSSTGYYVSAVEVASAISETPAALASIVSAVPSASTTVQGKVELATNAETEAGTSTTLAVTPAGLASTIASKAIPKILKLESAWNISKPNGASFIDSIPMNVVLDTQSGLTVDTTTGLITVSAPCIVDISATVMMASGDNNIAGGELVTRSVDLRIQQNDFITDYNIPKTVNSYIKHALTSSYYAIGVNGRNVFKFTAAGGSIKIQTAINGPGSVAVTASATLLVYYL